MPISKMSENYLYSATIIIRGKEHFLKYRCDDDPDTNAFEIDWDWENPEDRILDLTEEESEAVDVQLTLRYQDHITYDD